MSLVIRQNINTLHFVTFIHKKKLIITDTSQIARFNWVHTHVEGVLSSAAWQINKYILQINECILQIKEYILRDYEKLGGPIKKQ